jgi:hypothetical protein
LVTLAIAAAFVCATFLWRSVETWRAGKRTGAFLSLGAAAVAAIALAAFVYVWVTRTARGLGSVYQCLADIPFAAARLAMDPHNDRVWVKIADGQNLCLLDFKLTDLDLCESSEA